MKPGHLYRFEVYAINKEGESDPTQSEPVKAEAPYSKKAHLQISWILFWLSNHSLNSFKIPSLLEMPLLLGIRICVCCEDIGMVFLWIIKTVLFLKNGLHYLTFLEPPTEPREPGIVDFDNKSVTLRQG